MNFNDLPTMDWDQFETTEDWVNLLGQLRDMVASANTAQQRGDLADAFDAFADHSHSDDQTLINKLDRSAIASAQALRLANIDERIAALAAASTAFNTATQDLATASASLKKEASKLRFEKTTAAVTSLTSTVTTLRDLVRQLSAPASQEFDAALAARINQFVGNAQALRNMLEEPAPPSA
ncbi:hypothetical protein K2O51_33605 (plasmid) [Cupriavidus pinatubonensis]|uniref:hypothetical protein n=1 Tax=Cupriavidus pinatubonensis TaxID=248026 RepID=UPI001C734206|nr:hypothetical protein [Cupriavidus pinatubonensis]QYY33784.1 hypothetical protein K2O51_33605 [Cupriavidus pinatubonensis]